MLAVLGLFGLSLGLICVSLPYFVGMDAPTYKKDLNLNELKGL